ncbi:hypothetical protein F4802DRAFT_271096 [Xylaria palmicola]|nr:hypothetical protein F4802DRAFT_271096 [Xylaria palmicola]
MVATAPSQGTASRRLSKYYETQGYRHLPPILLLGDYPEWRWPFSSILPCDRLSVFAFIFSILLSICECMLQLLLFPALSGLLPDAVGLGISIGATYCLRQLHPYTWKHIQREFSAKICIKMLQTVLLRRQEELAAVNRSDDIVTVIRILTSEIPVFAVSLGQACHYSLGWLSIFASVVLLSFNILLRVACWQFHTLERIRETTIRREATLETSLR